MNMKPLFVQIVIHHTTIIFIQMIRGSILSVTVIILFVSACQPSVHQSENTSEHDHSTDSTMSGLRYEAIPDSVPGSPRIAAMANIGSAHVHIDYSTPAVRGRIVWGGLVPLGTIWVTGAHDATSITFPVDVNIEGQQISAGKYAFFTIPGESEWTLVLNKNWKQHLTRNYDQVDDVLRWIVIPTATDHTVRLRYDVISTGETTGRVTMTWEKIQIGFDFSI